MDWCLGDLEQEAQVEGEEGRGEYRYQQLRLRAIK